MIKRICLYGGPGSGKTTLAYKLAGALKERHHDIHLVQEFIKLWAYQKRIPKSFERLTVFERQLSEEDTWMPYVRAIITDSPILLSPIYSIYHKQNMCTEFLSITNEFEKNFPSLNFYLGRQFSYVQDGRYESEEEAKAVDRVIMDQMVQHLPRETTYFEPLSFDQMIEIIELELNKG